jgi:threonine/homoserine/homoserine lactone efflux protein
MLYYFIFGITYAFACVVQPGPFQAFLFSQSITNGWRRTIPLVFAPLISDLPVIIFVLLVLTNVPPEVLWLLQCFGGIYLLYLAFIAFRSWYAFDMEMKQKISPRQNILNAALVNFLNPNPYLGWSLVMGPLLIKGWQLHPANGIVLLAGFYGSMIIYSIGMIVLFAAARNLGPKVSRIAIGISVIALAVFGLYQLASGIGAFL